MSPSGFDLIAQAAPRINECLFRVIDTETTGVEPESAAICEVAFQDMLPDGTMLERFQSLIDPLMDIPPEASAVHHLTDADVRGKPMWETIKPRCVASVTTVEGDTVSEIFHPVYVAHNAEFDQKFTKIPGRWLCTHRLAKHLWPESSGHGNEHLRYFLKLEVDTVKDAASHRAVNDVMVTVALLKRALVEVRERWKDVETIDQLIQRANRPCLLKIVPFKSANGVEFRYAEWSLLRWIIDKQAGGPDVVYSAEHELARRSGEISDSGEL